MRPKLNFLACVQNSMWWETNTVHYVEPSAITTSHGGGSIMLGEMFLRQGVNGKIDGVKNLSWNEEL